MSVHTVAEIALLGLVVLSCWLGTLGMVRMREPIQGLHYLSLPACVGSVALVIAVYLRTGNSQATWKTLLIVFIMLAINSVVTHATARAFRTRDLGHWQPRPGDGIERVPRQKEQSA